MSGKFPIYLTTMFNFAFISVFVRTVRLDFKKIYRLLTAVACSGTKFACRTAVEFSVKNLLNIKQHSKNTDDGNQKWNQNQENQYEMPMLASGAEFKRRHKS